MKTKIVGLIILVLGQLISFSQHIRVAILDFENTSGIAKYDGLGKAMSSMLITDIESNVSPKRLQLVERAQIQKILKEQNFQSSSAVDKTTTVKAGKILGVKYLLVGDIYILNDVLVINARLTDTETGDIKFSKKQEGKLSTWLMLKTNIAKELALSISMPFTEPNIPDKEMNVATITTFGNAVVAKDEGKIEKAEVLLNTVQEFSPDFKYLDDLKNEIKELKNRLEKVEQDLEITTTDPISAAQNYENLGNFEEAEKYYQIGITRLKKEQLGEYFLYHTLIAKLCYKYQDYEKTINNCNRILDIYSFFNDAVLLKSQSLIKLDRKSEFIEWAKKYLEIANKVNDIMFFHKQFEIFCINNNIDFVYDMQTINQFSDGFIINIIDGENVLKGGEFLQMQNSKKTINSVLNQFAEINTEINGLASTLIFLNEIKSKKTIDNLEIENVIKKLN
jgi:TolB-like protein